MAVLVMSRVLPQSAVLVTVVAVTAVAWGLLLRVPVYAVGADEAH
jgi:hypothetical protein